MRVITELNLVPTSGDTVNKAFSVPHTELTFQPSKGLRNFLTPHSLNRAIFWLGYPQSSKSCAI